MGCPRMWVAPSGQSNLRRAGKLGGKNNTSQIRESKSGPREALIKAFTLSVLVQYHFPVLFPQLQGRGRGVGGGLFVTCDSGDTNFTTTVIIMRAEKSAKVQCEFAKG